MSIKSDIEDAFDNYGISGFTVWLLPDGRLQANICRADKVSWICCIGDDFESAARQALGQFLDNPPKQRKRVVKISQKRRRDIDDLA